MIKALIIAIAISLSAVAFFSYEAFNKWEEVSETTKLSPDSVEPGEPEEAEEISIPRHYRIGISTIQDFKSEGLLSYGRTNPMKPLDGINPPDPGMIDPPGESMDDLWGSDLPFERDEDDEDSEDDEDDGGDDDE